MDTEIAPRYQASKAFDTRITRVGKLERTACDTPARENCETKGTKERLVAVVEGTVYEDGLCRGLPQLGL